MPIYSFSFSSPRLLLTTSKIADWAIILFFKSFKLFFSLVLKLTQHNIHQGQTHHPMTFGIFVVLYCLSALTRSEHFYLPENDHAPPCNSSFPPFLTELHCRWLLSDSIVPLLSYYLALDPVGSSCFPSSSDFLLEKIMTRGFDLLMLCPFM